MPLLSQGEGSGIPARTGLAAAEVGPENARPSLR